MIGSLGRRARLAGSELLYAAGFALVLQREAWNLLRGGKVGRRVLLFQVFFTGVEALPVVALVSLGIGAAVILQGVSLLPQFGQDELAFRILILVITRELGPLLTALIIAARSGSAITTEIGNMMVDHEIEAYISAGINPIAYLAAPRLIGVTVALIILNLYFNLFGLLGSCWITSLIHHTPITEYLGKLVLVMTFGDVLTSFVKSLVFGMILATVATYYGFKVERAVTEVPQKTIQSLGVSMTLCILANTLITFISRRG